MQLCERSSDMVTPMKRKVLGQERTQRTSHPEIFKQDCILPPSGKFSKHVNCPGSSNDSNRRLHLKTTILAHFPYVTGKETDARR